MALLPGVVLVSSVWKRRGARSCSYLCNLLSVPLVLVQSASRTERATGHDHAHVRQSPCSNLAMYPPPSPPPHQSARVPRRPPNTRPQPLHSLTMVCCTWPPQHSFLRRHRSWLQKTRRRQHPSRLCLCGAWCRGRWQAAGYSSMATQTPGGHNMVPSLACFRTCLPSQRTHTHTHTHTYTHTHVLAFLVLHRKHLLHCLHPSCLASSWLASSL